MSYTIKEIAEIAGVSAGTVDRVIHNRGKVNPETEAKIRKIIEMIDYRPNTLAQSLALKKKKLTIGVVIHVQEDYINYTISSALAGLKDALNEYSDFGVSAIILHSRNFDADSQVQLIDQALSQNICALLIMPINAPVVCSKLDEVIAAGIPVMCFNNDIATSRPHFFCGNDGYVTGCIAAGMLNLAHKAPMDLGIFSSSTSLTGNMERNRGLVDTIDRLYPHHKIAFLRELPNDDIDSYVSARKTLSEFNGKISALLIASGAHNSVIRALKALNMLGTLTVVSIDAPECIMDELRLGNISSVVSQNSYQHGFQSVKTICELVFNNHLPVSQHIVIDTTIMIREHII